MVLFGSIVDGLACIVGGLLGLVLKQKVSQKLGDFLMIGIALCLMMMGVQGMVQAQHILATTLEIIVGSAIGYALNIDGQIRTFGAWIQKMYARGDSSHTQNISSGFINATLIVCVGAMAIVGSLQSGLMLDHTTLLTKSIMDFVICILLAATMGIGVMLSGVCVFVYQAALTLAAQSLALVLTESVIQEMMVVGSLLLFALGLDMCGIKKIPVANMLPACVMPILVLFIMQILGTL